MLTSSEQEGEKGGKFTTFSTLKFKVLIFSDLHYGEDAQVDANSSAFQERLLELEAPVDLVVLNGDMSSNYAAPGFCSNAERRTDPIVRALCREWWRNRW